MNSFFGTDGIRAPIGTGLFTQHQLHVLANTISAWAVATYRSAHHRAPRVIIVHDTRNSCAYIKSLFKSALLAHSIDVFDAQVLPTPAATWLLESYDADCALVISASHNSWQDNGIKIIERSGKLSAQAEQTISAAIAQPQDHTPAYHALGNEFIIDGKQTYLNNVKRIFAHDFLKNQKIVIDCAHGATYHLASVIFEHFGAQVITLNNQPDGFNINKQSGSLHPQDVQSAVREHTALVGFAFDGDGDRVIAVNRAGEIKNGDAILALLSTHADYRNEATVIGTIMSNHGLQALLLAQGKQFIRTAVGDKYVAQELAQRGALLGGEQSGHIILRNHTNTGDGVLVALKVAETILAQQNYDFHTFTPYPQVLLTVPVKRMCDLAEKPYESLIAAARQLIPSGRISVRYSGTEKNMLRVMVESAQLHEADTIAHQLATSLQKELS